MKENYLIALLSICILTSVYEGQAQIYDDAKALRTQLFARDSYEKTIRPVTNQSNAVGIRVEFYLFNVNELDEVAETLQTTGYLDIYWTDVHLQWDPADYSGLESSFFPQVFVSTCSIDITYFPFDIQTCTLTFLAWSYYTDQVQLQSEIGIVMDDFETNASWNIIATSWEVPQSFDDTSVHFRIKLRRKPMYHILTLVLPIILLSFLNIIVFILPSNSGEKSGYAITVFLAFAVFLTIVTSTMPENSDTTAVVSIYIFLQTGQSTVITTLALIMVRCNSFDENVTSIPKALIVLAAIGKCKPCRNRRKEYNADRRSVNDDTDLEQPLEVCTWNDVINGLDVFCFILFGFNIVLTTKVTLCVSWFGTQYLV